MIKWFWQVFLLISLHDYVGEIEGHEVPRGPDRATQPGGGLLTGEFWHHQADPDGPGGLHQAMGNHLQQNL